MNSALHHALKLAGQGIPSFPCLPSKAPACPGGFRAATSDPDSLLNLWNRYPGGLAGVPTGSISGWDVLDIDPQNGGDDWLSVHQAKLPITRIHKTRSGGVHIFFKHKEGLRNSAGKIAPGVDVRAEGGYVIWWPAADLQVVNVASPADWPEWLLELAVTKPARVEIGYHVAPRTGSGYAHAALKDAARKLVTAPEGTRNDTLNREMFSMRRFINSGELDIHDVTATLLSAALSAGLGAKEATATIVSALRAKVGAV